VKKVSGKLEAICTVRDKEGLLVNLSALLSEFVSLTSTAEGAPRQLFDEFVNNLREIVNRVQTDKGFLLEKEINRLKILAITFETKAESFLITKDLSEKQFADLVKLSESAYFPEIFFILKRRTEASLEDISRDLNVKEQRMTRAFLKRLTKAGFISTRNNSYSLTENGMKQLRILENTRILASMENVSPLANTRR